ncbi:MAG: hypothetical protein JXP73_09405 [Deltaproteobacteria bacterium]|nr:hypothetical protein [Deltaproteobacteria bacterium]
MELVPSQAALRRAIAAAGAAALLAQVVMLREILALSQGNELVLGLVLFLWLCLTGLLSGLGARFAGARPAVRLAHLLVLSPLLLLGSLWLTRFASTGALGQAPSLTLLLLVSFTALLPACALGGLSFAWAAALAGEGRATAIYVAETAGAAVAGLLFHALLAEYLAAGWILCLAGTASAAAGAAVLWPHKRGVGLAAAATLVALVACPAVERSLVRARFPGERVLAVQPSRYGLLSVVARGEQRVFFHDGVLLFTSEDAIAAEETTHLPMLLHPRPRRVLMAGGGLGGGLALALEHRPEALDYAEMDPALLALARRYADERTRAALADARVAAASRDGRALLRAAAGRYDVVLVNLPVAQNALVARLSTRECLADARRALAPGGILALVTPGGDAYLDPAARQRHASLLTALAAVFPEVGVAPGAQTVFWASAAAVEARPDLLVRRLGERGLRPLHIGQAWLFDRLLPLHVQWYRRGLAAAPQIENRDFRPVIYLFGVIEQLERISPKLGRAALGFVRRPWVGWLFPGAILALAGLAFALRRGGRAPGFAAAAAGATGMSLEIVLLLGFQALVGHLYHALGGMLAGFMAGMAAGALLASRFLDRERALAAALALAAAVASLAAGLLIIGQSLPALAGPAVVLGIVLVGATTGAVYPLAVEASARGHAAARIYAWDLAGAAGAALLVTMLAIPLLGLLPVAGLGAALCAAAALANLRRA